MTAAHIRILAILEMLTRSACITAEILILYGFISAHGKKQFLVYCILLYHRLQKPGNRYCISFGSNRFCTAGQ
jgi:hypothetical protein